MFTDATDSTWGINRQAFSCGTVLLLSLLHPLCGCLLSRKEERRGKEMARALADLLYRFDRTKSILLVYVGMPLEVNV